MLYSAVNKQSEIPNSAKDDRTSTSKTRNNTKRVTKPPYFHMRRRRHLVDVLRASVEVELLLAAADDP